MASVILAGFVVLLITTNLVMASPLIPDILRRALEPQCNIHTIKQLYEDVATAECYDSSLQQILKLVIDRGYISAPDVVAALILTCDQSEKYKSCVGDVVDECPFGDALKRSNEKKFAFCSDEVFEWMKEYAASHQNQFSSSCMRSVAFPPFHACFKENEGMFSVFKTEPDVETAIVIMEGILNEMFTCFKGKFQTANLSPNCTGDMNEILLVSVSFVLFVTAPQPGVSFPLSELKDVQTLISQN